MVVSNDCFFVGPGCHRPARTRIITKRVPDREVPCFAKGLWRLLLSVKKQNKCTNFFRESKYSSVMQCHSIQGTDNLLPSFAKPDLPKTPPPIRPPAPKVMVDGKALIHKDEPTMEQLQAEIKELRMALELLETRHEWVLQIYNADMLKFWARCKTLSLKVTHFASRFSYNNVCTKHVNERHRNEKSSPFTYFLCATFYKVYTKAALCDFTKRLISKGLSPILISKGMESINF